MRISHRKILFGVAVTLSLLMISDCKKSNPSSAPSEESVDTTSHNITFTQYTFGGQGGSSYFKDVAIINDSDIWAVGEIHTDSGKYNATHWDGTKWNLISIPYVYQGQNYFHPISAVFALSSNDVWFAGNGMERWDGQSFSNVEGINAVWGPYEMNKIWMSSDNNIFVIGDGGSIAYFNGIWNKLISGTTVDLRDVWGASDPEGAGGKTVWACGYSNNNSQSILLKYDGTSWTTIWEVGATSTPPYGDLIISIWGNNDLFVSSNIGVYKQNINGIDTAKRTLALNHFPYRVRGSAENNIVVVGDYAMIWHWNGVDWKLLNETSPDQPLYSVAISKNIIAAVGSDYSTFPNAALIYVGKRE